MSVSGTQELSCGTASFKFDKPEMAGDDRAEPEPEAAPQSDLTCGFATNQGDPDTFLPLDAITKAADQFCDGIGKKKQKEAEHKEFFDFGDKKTVFVAMSLDQDASCPKFNLKDKSSVETCKREFNRIIHSCELTLFLFCIYAGDLLTTARRYCEYLRLGELEARRGDTRLRYLVDQAHLSRFGWFRRFCMMYFCYGSRMP
jgi:hypothetical protein